MELHATLSGGASEASLLDGLYIARPSLDKYGNTLARGPGGTGTTAVIVRIYRPPSDSASSHADGQPADAGHLNRKSVRNRARGSTRRSAAEPGEVEARSGGLLEDDLPSG
jgi:hypothetical protein